tara:strand:- start:619 stop:1380 length:762 start_codon:yes stop_codon:yes gene_type:complete
MREKDLKEDLATLAYKAESDHEVQMARSDLYKIAKYSIKLHEMLKAVNEQQGIEGWVQSKITKAADYMGSVYHHLDYEMKFDEMTENKTKPDFPDIDNDGDTKEPIGKAAKDKKAGGEDKPKKGLSAKQKKLPAGLQKAIASKKESYMDTLAFKLEEAKKQKGLYYNVNKRKKAGTSRSKDHPDAPSEKDWKNAAKTAKESKERTCPDCNKPSYKTLPEEKQKGVDGKVCWKGYKRMGTKKKGGKTVDNCVKM